VASGREDALIWCQPPNGASDPYSGLLGASFAQDGASSSGSREPSPQLRSVDLFAAEPEPPSQPIYRPPTGTTSPPRSTSPYNDLKQLDLDSRSASPASSLTRRMSSRNPYSALVESTDQAAPLPVRGQDSPSSRFASKNPFLPRGASQSSLSSSPLETTFPSVAMGRSASPEPLMGQGHDLPPIVEREDRNPFHALSSSSTSPTTAFPRHLDISNGAPPSPTTPRSYRTQRTGSNGSSILTPTAPSDKAYGKMRQVSLYGDSMEDVARQAELERLEEERVRARYAREQRQQQAGEAL
jgi:hypothetical protein